MNRGFTLIELMIVVAIIAIIAAIAIPGLLQARIGANESSAIGTLKSMISSQENYRTQSINDGDGDGEGEYGYMSQLSGAQAPFRNVAGAPAVDPNGTLIAQGRATFISPQFGVTNATSEISKSGFLFLHLLPTAGATAAAEGANSGAPAVPAAVAVSDQQEVRWSCYAWPVNAGQTGTRAFVSNQSGEIAQHDNKVAGGGAGFNYTGVGSITTANCDRAYLPAAGTMNPLDLEGGIGIANKDATGTLVSNSTDTLVWQPVK